MTWLERIRPAHLVAALVVLVIGADVLFFPFYADDFHFLDVARHRPLPELLTGQYGIWPWYRPLSRELFFVLLVQAGPWGALLGHAIEVLTVALAAVLVHRITTRMAGAVAGAIAAMIFVTYEATKLLASWASGFQDLLALALTLGAIDALQRSRHRAALVMAALAPLAKEPAFIVYPILVLYLAWFGRTLPAPPKIRTVTLTALIPLTVHVSARLTWSNLTSIDPGLSSPPFLPAILLQALRFFVSPEAAVTPQGLIFGLAAAGVAWLCLAGAASEPESRDGLSARRAAGWFGCSAVLGLMPLVAGNFLVTYANAYHAIPAIPWAAMLLGTALARVPGRLLRVAMPAFVLWNTLGLAVVPPKLEDPAAWQAPFFTWRDALRFVAVTERVEADLHVLLADRPESLVVLFQNMPPRTFLQTEDGPAVRELLRDPTLRSYWTSEVPWLPEGSAVRILTFDFDSLRLRRADWSEAEALHLASNAIIAGRGSVAAAILRQAIPPGGAEPARTYLLLAAELVDRGPEAYLRRLRGLGWADTAAPELVEVARARAGGDPGLLGAHRGVVAQPLTSAPFVALADVYAEQGAIQGAAFGLRLAVTLKPDLWSERMRLVDLMLQLGGTREALEELTAIAAAGASAGPYAVLAHRRIPSLQALEAERLSNTPPLLEP